MLVDNLAADPKTKPCANIFLGGKEGLKDAAPIFHRNPSTRIGYGHTGVAATFQCHSARAYPDHSLRSRSINRIRQQVRNDLPNLASNRDGYGTVTIMFNL